MKKYKIPKLNVKANGRIFLTTYCVRELDLEKYSYMTITIHEQNPYLVLVDKYYPQTKYLSIYPRGKYSRICSKKIREQLEAIYADLSDYSFVVDIDRAEYIEGQIHYPLDRVA